MIETKPYSELSRDELYSILRLRAEVFVVEQNCPYQDLDGNDQRAVHVFEKDQAGEVVACLRVFVKDDGNLTIGRVVTATAVRGTGTGKRLVLKGIEIAKSMAFGFGKAKGIGEAAETNKAGEAEETDKASPAEAKPRCVIHAQCYAIGFYEKCGFSVCSEEFLEDGIPHKEMDLQL